MPQWTVLCTSSPGLRIPLAEVPERLLGDLEDIVELLNKANVVENISVPFRTPQKSLNLTSVELHFHSLKQMRATNTVLGEEMVLESLRELDQSLDFSTQSVSERLEALVEESLAKSLQFQPYSLLTHPVAVLNFVSGEEALKLNLSETLRFKLGLFDRKVSIVFVVVEEVEEGEFLKFQKKCENSGFGCVKLGESLVKSVLLGYILGFMENLIFQKYYEISKISNSKNYFYSKFIGSNVNTEHIQHRIANVDGSEKVTTKDVFYSSQTPEFKTLHLADLYFSLQDYKNALFYYKQLKQLYNQHVSPTLFSFIAKNEENCSEMSIKDEIQVYKAAALFQISLCLFELQPKGFLKEVLTNLSKMQSECFQPIISKCQNFFETPVFIRLQTYYVYVITTKVLAHLQKSNTIEQLRDVCSTLSNVINRASFHETRLFSGLLLHRKAHVMLLSKAHTKDIISSHSLPNTLNKQYVRSGRSRKFGFLLLMTSSIFRQLSLPSLAFYFLSLGEQIYDFCPSATNCLCLHSHIASIRASLTTSQSFPWFSAIVKINEERYTTQIKAFMDTDQPLLKLNQEHCGVIRQDNASLLPDFEGSPKKATSIYLNEPSWWQCRLESLVNFSLNLKHMSLIYSFRGKPDVGSSSGDALITESKELEILPYLDSKDFFFKLDAKTDCTIVLKGVQLTVDKFGKTREVSLHLDPPLEIKSEEQREWLGVDIVNLKERVIENEVVEAEMEVLNNGTVALQQPLTFSCSSPHLVQPSDSLKQVSAHEYELVEEVEVGVPLSVPMRLWFRNVFLLEDRVDVVFSFGTGERAFEVRKEFVKEKRLNIRFRRLESLNLVSEREYKERVRDVLEVKVEEAELEEVTSEGFEEMGDLSFGKERKMLKRVQKKGKTEMSWRVSKRNESVEGKSVLILE